MTEPIAGELPKVSFSKELTGKLAKNPIQTALLETTSEVKPPKWFTNVANKVLNAWFDPKSYESTEMYEKIGIRPFKKYLPTSGDLVHKYVWNKFGAGDFVSRGPESLKNFDHSTKVCEAIHTAFFALMVAETAVALSLGATNTAAFSVGLNVLVNVYPIMLQRYNRIRLYRAINKLNSEPTDKTS